MKMTKLLSVLLALLMVAAMVAGCAKSPSETASPQATAAPAADAATPADDGTLTVGAEPKTLKVMTWVYTDAAVEALNQTIALYNEKYPNVTVEPIVVQDYLTEYKLAFDANEGPDVVYVDDTTQVLLERYNYETPREAAKRAPKEQ